MTYSREDVERALTLAWPGRWVREVRAAGAGLSGQVFRASSEDWGPIAIKVSPGGIRGNLNDRPKDQRALLIQDAELLEHVRAHGLPAPHAIAVGEAAGLVMLAMEWVENDGSPVPARDLGRLCARLHRVPPPSMQLVEQDYETVELTVAGRLEMRLRGLQALTGESFLSRGRLERVLEAVSRTSRSRPSLLHLDFRPANLLSRHGAVTGIIDWANAMISEPALELARVEEAGLLSDDFVAGYRELMPVQAVDPLRYLGFRLDTAVMLANIFLVEAPDQRLALKQLDRVREVCSRIEAVDSDPKRG